MSREVKRKLLFSICVPVYNAEPYLKDCIESVLGQAKDYTEIILVDDGSSDGSGTTCDFYAKKYPEIIRVLHQSNQGPMIARDSAVKMATGDFLLFLDSDDMFVPNALEKIKMEIETYNADVVLFDMIRWSNNEETEVMTAPFENHSVFEGTNKTSVYVELSTRESLNSLCRKCISRRLYDISDDVFEKGNIKQGEDKLISFFCLEAANRIVYLKERLYRYRTNYNSTTNNAGLYNYKNLQVVFSYTEQYMKKWNLPLSAIIQQKSGILSAATDCVSLIYSRNKRGIGAKTELREAVYYIADDKRLVDAYSMGKHLIHPVHRITIWLIMKRYYRFVTLWLGILETVRKIKR